MPWVTAPPQRTKATLTEVRYRQQHRYRPRDWLMQPPPEDRSVYRLSIRRPAAAPAAQCNAYPFSTTAATLFPAARPIAATTTRRTDPSTACRSEIPVLHDGLDVPPIEDRSIHPASIRNPGPRQRRPIWPAYDVPTNSRPVSPAFSDPPADPIPAPVRKPTTAPSHRPPLSRSDHYRQSPDSPILPTGKTQRPRKQHTGEFLLPPNEHYRDSE